MASQLLCRASVRARHTAVCTPAASSLRSAVLPALSACVATSAPLSSVSVRSLHSSGAWCAPEPKAKGKGKKEVFERGPLVIPTAMSEYEFAHMNVLKDYKDPADKVTLRPDSAYPEWIWDQTPEPTWSDLLLADFASLPPTYQKKVFSIPRKQEIKRKNDLSRKG